MIYFWCTQCPGSACPTRFLPKVPECHLAGGGVARFLNSSGANAAAPAGSARNGLPAMSFLSPSYELNRAYLSPFFPLLLLLPPSMQKPAPHFCPLKKKYFFFSNHPPTMILRYGPQWRTYRVLLTPHLPKDLLVRCQTIMSSQWVGTEGHAPM